MKLRYSIDVPHMCPKLGRMIIIDTSKTPTCLSCGFAVYKLVIKSHPYLKYVMACNFVPVIVALSLVFFTDVTNYIALAISLPMHAAPFFAGQWLIAEKSASFYKYSLQELRNWNARV